MTEERRYRLSREEQETVIRGSAADQEWDVWTCDPRFVRYLRRQGYDPGPDHQSRDAVSCRVPFRKIRIVKKDSQMTAQQRANLARGVKFGEENPRSFSVKP